MTTVAELIIEAIADHGTTEVWGVVGDALNPVTDAIRREERLRWMGVRHEEVAAFAAGAQAQLTGRLGVCMGTVGPGAIHLLNGLYDAKKSHAPVLAICGQVPRAEIGSDFFQEVDNDVLFADVSVFTATVTDPSQLPTLLEQAGNAALQQGGVAVLTVPGDVGELEVAKGTAVPRFVAELPTPAPTPESVRAAVDAIAAAERVTLLVGQGAAGAREEVLELAERLAAPMVVALKGKQAFDHDNPYEIGQSGLLGNPATTLALETCDLLLMVGTDFPYKEFYPSGPRWCRSTATAPTSGGGTRSTTPWSATPGSRSARCCRTWSAARTEATSTARARRTRPGRTCSSTTSTRPTRRSPPASCAARSTTPTAGSVPSCSPGSSTATRPPTPSSPPTPGWPRPGCRASCASTATGACSARSTSARWPTRCPRRWARRRSTTTARSSRCAATAA